MSGRYYRRRGYWRNNYSRRNYYYRRGNTTRVKSWGNMRAAKQQADQATFTINVPSNISAFLKTPSNPETDDPSTQRGIYAMNIYDVLRKSSFYQSYANMYDEFKIDRIKVKLLPTEYTYTATAGTNNGTGNYKNVTVYTAWDRTGLSSDQIVVNLSGILGNVSEIGTDQNTAGVYTAIGTDITTYSSSESRIVNPGSNTSIVRWLNPKTIQEKGQWISTSSLKLWYNHYDDQNGRYYGIPTNYNDVSNNIMNGDVEIGTEVDIGTSGGENPTQELTESVFIEKLSALNKENPCYLLEDNSVRFKPTLLVGVYPAVTGNGNNLCRFNVETEVVCSFRGLRKARVVAALYDEENPPSEDEDWTFEPTKINENGAYKMEENANGDFYPKLDPNYNPNDEDDYYDIKVEVPSNNEYLVNKLINNNGTITVSNLMTSPNTKDGISKNSTLEVSVNPYLPNNYQQTLNYVGYWKWDSTNQTFIQVLNNQDIIDGKYNLKIQPLFYDADTGLPQKVRIESGDTKRLKMVNDNNDGASEIMEYVEPNLMVKFNSRTRSVTEYPYFEVEALPPTITSPVTSNGYYKFDGNTLIQGDVNDYNLNVNVNSISKINIKSFISINNSVRVLLSNFSLATSTTSIPVSSGRTCIRIENRNDYYYILMLSNITSSTKNLTASSGTYYIVGNYGKEINFCDENNNNVVYMYNGWNTSTGINTIISLYKTNFNLILN